MRSPARPFLSVLVVAYKMPHQAVNTLYTLSADYQRGVDPDDYEVIVVENASDQPMDALSVAALHGNFTHVYRHEPGVSPVPALNAALAASRGRYIGIMIDGARMVTPGLLRNVFDVFGMDPNALVTPLGYHLGDRDQQEMHDSDYNTEIESQLLGGLPQQGDGYRLFDLACLSQANPRGCLNPMMESNSMFVARSRFDAIGGADERFDLVGGGMVNLDIFRQLSELPGTTLWMLPGEGSFHQVHGGVTTQPDEGREELMAAFRAQYLAIRGEPFKSPTREPHLFGEVNDRAMEVLRFSAAEGAWRFVRRTALGEPVWMDEATVPRQTPWLIAELAAELGIDLERIGGPAWAAVAARAH